MSKPYDVCITGCVFCGKVYGKAGATCGTGEEHCHHCFRPRSREADPCVGEMTHYWQRGHNFQRVPLREQDA